VAARDKPFLEALGLGVLFVALYGLTAFPTPPPVGDAADYTAILRGGVLPERMAPHVGYYLLGRPVMLLGTMLGTPATVVAHGLATVAMAGSIAFAYLIFRQLALTRFISVTAALILGTSGLVWYNALQGEVTAVCMFLLLGSMLLFLHDRPLSSGAAFGLALLVTQLAAPWAVTFPVLAAWRRNWRSLALATCAGTVILVAGVAPVAHDYFYGVRGAFNVAERLQPVSLPKFVLYSGYRLLESFTILVPAIVLGIFVAARRCRIVVVLAGLLLLATSAISIRSLHVEYGVTWIPAFPGLAALAAIGISAAANTFRSVKRRHGAAVAVVVAVVAVAAILTGVLYVQPKRADAIRFAREARVLSSIAGSARVVAAPEEGMAYVGVTQPDAPDVWSSSWVMAPITSEEWQRILSTYGAMVAFEIDPEPHLLRRWLFNNSLARRYLNENQRAEFTSEMAGGVFDAVGEVGASVDREPVLDTGYVRAWRLRPRVAAATGTRANAAISERQNGSGSP
jgi:hypothetical protein